MPTLLSSTYPQVGTLALATPAHLARGWATIHTLPSLKGTNPDPQGVDGQTFRQKNHAAIEFDFDVIVMGLQNDSGVAYPDPHDGLRQNMDQLATAIDTRNATVELRHVYASGGYRSAQVEIDPRNLDQINPHTVRVTLRFVVVDATWTWTP